MKVVLLGPGADVTELTKIHASAFAEPWGAAALSDLLGAPGTFAGQLEGGFILVRAAAGEAEILTIAVRSEQRRHGAGTTLVRFAAEHAQKMGAATLFLEVAVGNQAARGLYGGLGFTEVGRRRAYYALGQGKFEDALILRSNLPLSGLGNRPASG